MAVTVVLRNGTSAGIDVGGVVVELRDSHSHPGILSTSEPSEPFAGSLNPGSTGTGVYVFRVPVGDRTPITVSVNYSTQTPVVLFVGDVT